MSLSIFVFHPCSYSEFGSMPLTASCSFPKLLELEKEGIHFCVLTCLDASSQNALSALIGQASEVSLLGQTVSVAIPSVLLVSPQNLSVSAM